MPHNVNPKEIVLSVLTQTYLDLTVAVGIISGSRLRAAQFNVEDDVSIMLSTDSTICANRLQGQVRRLTSPDPSNTAAMRAAGTDMYIVVVSSSNAAQAMTDLKTGLSASFVISDNFSAGGSTWFDCWCANMGS